ncbi:MAG: DUF3592 domain-containing protein [Cellulosilyticaceae bacterium]
MTGIALLVAGIILSYIPIHEWRTRRKLLEDRHEVSGKIIQNIFEDHTVYPVIALKWQGDNYTVRSAMALPLEKYQVGEKVRVYFHPQDLEGVYIKGYNPRQRLLVLTMLMGFICIDLGIYFLILPLIS